MRFGIFYEHRLLKDALEQVELADRLGIEYLWLVEHHCCSGSSLHSTAAKSGMVDSCWLRTATVHASTGHRDPSERSGTAATGSAPEGSKTAHRRGPKR